LNRYISREPGPIKNDRGRVLGQHVGLSFYTLGQRQGLGIGGVKDKKSARGGGDHEPWYVARKEVDANTLWVVQGHDHPWLQSLALDAPTPAGRRATAPGPGAYAAKTRYRQTDAPCTLAPERQRPISPGFPAAHDPQWAVTPGSLPCCMTATGAWAAA
jgi:tRNA-specific 2-thiouridylase